MALVRMKKSTRVLFQRVRVLKGQLPYIAKQGSEEQELCLVIFYDNFLGLYVMKHYRMPAPAFISWNRICRPGSVLGPQQQFLCAMQEIMYAEGKGSKIFEELGEEVQENIKKFSVFFSFIFLGNEN